MPETLTFTLADDPANRLDKTLARDVPAEAALSRSRLAKLIEAGEVRINGEVVRDLRMKAPAGAEVEITLPAPVPSEIQGEDIPLDIYYEDDDLLVVNKPAGMVVHPAPGSPSGTLVNAVIAHCGDKILNVGGQGRPGIVHRIDKLTSGLLVVAKTDAAQRGLAAQFAKHSVKRRYEALCYGVPDTGDPRMMGLRGVSAEPGGIVKVTTQIGRHKHDRQRQAVYFDGHRHAITRLKVEERFGSPAVIARISCWLETGRTHQIRVHLAHAGHALIGDPVYGGARKVKPGALPEGGVESIADFPRQALHAAELGFIHPVSREALSFAAPLPEDMQALISAVGGTNPA